MLNIGCHLSTSKGFKNMGKEALSIGANTFQFFTRNPRGGKAKDIDAKDVNELLEIMKKNNFVYDMVVVDQFTPERNYYNYLKSEPNVFRKIKFTTKAEDKCLSVACSSIISRYLFLKEIEKMGNSLGSFIPKGASTLVDDYGKKIVQNFGKEKLRSIAKLNFKNTEKILNEN